MNARPRPHLQQNEAAFFRQRDAAVHAAFLDAVVRQHVKPQLVAVVEQRSRAVEQGVGALQRQAPFKRSSKVPSKCRHAT
jgi:hypothetical protein